MRSSAARTRTTGTTTGMWSNCLMLSPALNVRVITFREKPVDAGRNFPDLGERFKQIEKLARQQHVASILSKMPTSSRLVDPESLEKELWEDSVSTLR